MRKFKTVIVLRRTTGLNPVDLRKTWYSSGLFSIQTSKQTSNGQANSNAHMLTDLAKKNLTKASLDEYLKASHSQKFSFIKNQDESPNKKIC